MAKKITKISELSPDKKNFNKGSEFGNSLINKSISKFGLGRSILLDKNNQIIAGNKPIENMAALGLEDVEVIESDGKRIIAVKRTDIDLDSPEGRELALADNMSSLKNIVMDAAVIAAELGEAVCEEWGVDLNKEGEPKEPTGKLSDKFGIPPFSVLNAREGWWQNRKRQWLSLGIESEVGRGGGLLRFSSRAEISTGGKGTPITAGYR